MNKLITTTARKTLTRSLAAGLLVAVTTMLPGTNAAQAADQQTTETQSDDAINHRAAAEGYGYANVPRYQPGAYARVPGHARDSGITAPTPELDFQLQGRQ